MDEQVEGGSVLRTTEAVRKSVALELAARLGTDPSGKRVQLDETEVLALIGEWAGGALEVVGADEGRPGAHRLLASELQTGFRGWLRSEKDYADVGMGQRRMSTLMVEVLREAGLDWHEEGRYFRRVRWAGIGPRAVVRAWVEDSLIVTGVETDTFTIWDAVNSFDAWVVMSGRDRPGVSGVALRDLLDAALRQVEQRSEGRFEVVRKGREYAGGALT